MNRTHDPNFPHDDVVFMLKQVFQSLDEEWIAWWKPAPEHNETIVAFIDGEACRLTQGDLYIHCIIFDYYPYQTKAGIVTFPTLITMTSTLPIREQLEIASHIASYALCPVFLFAMSPRDRAERELFVGKYDYLIYHEGNQFLFQKLPDQQSLETEAPQN